MVQTTFLKAFRAFDSFREGSDERSWLYSILLNSIRDFSRKAARSPEVIELDNLDESYLSDNSDNPENNLLLVEREERLAKGISSLPEHFAQPLILSDIQEMSYKEIARVLQIPIGTVMSRLSRARASLMKLVQAD
jgi:RNA polymerase sigma-70 factor (ECF subfamily)